MKKNHIEKEKIIDVAVDFFGEKGYAATSIRDISKALDVSIATLYYYFKNKEELLLTIIEAIGDDLLKTIQKAKEVSDDPLEGLRRMLEAHIRLTEKKKSRVKIYVEEQHNLSKKYKKIIYNQHRHIYDVYAAQLKALQEAGTIDAEPVSVTAFAMFGMVNWCYRWFRKDGALPIEEVSEKIIHLLFYGIVKPEDKTSR